MMCILSLSKRGYKTNNDFHIDESRAEMIHWLVDQQKIIKQNEQLVDITLG